LGQSQSGSVWKISFSAAAERAFGKLDKAIQGEIIEYLSKRIATAESPRRFGKALTHGLAGLWRYRVRDYRIVCRIEDDEIRVLVLGIGHRKDIYR
jgi:mRNA interferase RelE/StbE